jgi:solute carrier family 36 (proton-coupled amino acid transporter)
MLGITLLYCIFGSLNYISYGAAVRSIVTLNLPPSPPVVALLLLYVLAVALTFPLVIFPAVKTLEGYIFKVPLPPHHHPLK